MAAPTPSENVRNLNRRWMLVHFVLNLAACALIILAEIAIYCIIKKMNMFDMPESRYVRMYIVLPAVLILFTMIVQIVLFQSAIPDRSKYVTLIVGLLLPCAIVFIIHGYYRALSMLFVLPVIASVNYGDVKLTRRTSIATIPVELVAGQLSAYFISGQVESTLDGIMNMVLSLVIQVCIMILCIAIVHNENHKFSAIDAEEKERLKAEKQARTDSLTGLSNRIALREVFNDLLAEPHKPYVLAMCDLDNFKLCNDRLGHPEGDATLVKFARALCHHSDMGFRYGGDEFCIIFRDMDLQKAILICRQITVDFNAAISDDVRKLKVAPSFGLAESSEKLQPSEVIHHADVALYRAKKLEDEFICTYCEYF